MQNQQAGHLPGLFFEWWTPEINVLSIIIMEIYCLNDYIRKNRSMKKART